MKLIAQHHIIHLLPLMLFEEASAEGKRTALHIRIHAEYCTRRLLRRAEREPGATCLWHCLQASLCFPEQAQEIEKHKKLLSMSSEK